MSKRLPYKTIASLSHRWSMASPLTPRFPRTSSSRSTRLSATTAASNLDLQKRDIPRPSSRKAESGDAHIYIYIQPVCESGHCRPTLYIILQPSYIILLVCSSSTSQKYTPFPYPMNPPKPKSIRYPAVPI